MIRTVAILLTLLAWAGVLQAREVRDTLFTRQRDRIILTYSISSDGNTVSMTPRQADIYPSSSSNKLREACEGDFNRLKVVVFDKAGGYGKVTWKGNIPSTFTVPSGLHHDISTDGYYIFGESAPITFSGTFGNGSKISFPVYIALYEKKRTYRILASATDKLIVTPWQLQAATRSVRSAQMAGEPGWKEERIAIESTEEISASNGDITGALSSVALVKELLASETEYPFSETLRMELANLRMLKNQVSDPEIVAKINEVLKLGSERERELKALQESDAAASAAAEKAEQQAMMEQQKAEAAAQQREAEEKARQQEEKQQKRTLWMIIGGVLLAVLGFVGNGIFKHFRDVKSQKNIIKMQESLTRQAQNEASRRSREIVRNKTHQAVNKGKTKLYGKVKETTTKTTNKKSTNRRSI